MQTQPTTASDDLIGQSIAGRYEVFAKLGQGGMGVVYAARQSPLGRTVAIKVLLRDMTADPVAASRFEKEALAISRLSHPNIVTIFDFGNTDAGHKFIAMEFLDGRTLRDIVGRDGPISPKRTVRILMYIARALADAHRQGIIHRDLKPDNIMVLASTGEPDFVKVLDFGVAKLKNREGEANHTVTSQDVILGTPKYMSPEQINGITDDPRSDLYALGAMVFEMLTGRVPFEGDSPVKILMKHLQDEPPLLKEVLPTSRASELLEDLVLSLLHKDMNRRPQSAVALLELLEDLPEYTGPRSRLMTRTGMPALKDLPLAAPEPVAQQTQLDNAPTPVQPVMTASQQATRMQNVGSTPPRSGGGSLVEPTQSTPPPRFTPLATEMADSVFTHTRLSPVAPVVPSTPANPTRTDPAASPVNQHVNPHAPTPAMEMEAAIAAAELASSPHIPVMSAQSRPLEELSTHLTRPRMGGKGALVVGGLVLLLGVVGLGVMASKATGGTTAPVAMPAPVPAPVDTAGVVPVEKVLTPVDKTPPPVVEKTPPPVEKVAAATEKVPPPAEARDPAPVKEEPRRQRQAMVPMTVISIPAGAQVLENGDVKGTTPAVIQLPKGNATHTLTLRMAGFKDEVRSGKADKARTFTVKMFKDNPRPEPTPVRNDPPVEKKPEPAPVKADPPPVAKAEPAPVAPKKELKKDAPKFEKWDDLKDPTFNPK